MNVIKEAGSDYDAIKTAFLKLYLEDENESEWSELLSTARKKSAETLREFYVRLSTAFIELSEEPNFEALYKKYWMLTCFPSALQYTLTTGESEDTFKVLTRGYEWAKTHPQTKLTDANIGREEREASPSQI